LPETETLPEPPVQTDQAASLGSFGTIADFVRAFTGVVRKRNTLFFRYFGMMLKKLFLLVLPLLIVSGCIQPPDYPIEPEIEFISLSKTTLISGKDNEDETLLTIAFTDGDGDIGNFKPDGTSELDMFLIDSRTGDFDEKFSIPFVPELGASNGISGEVYARIFTTCCIYPDFVTDAPTGCDPSEQYPVDTLIYEIYIMDRAGNESNHVFSDPIYILCNQ
jgi:hypothetical protein